MLLFSSILNSSISLGGNLTMVDLPGITRVPVHGQPENIYDQIKDIIMEYIRPEERIILNVLSSTVDFTTCESIRMSQSVDKTGLRTLAVVTKADKSPEGLLEKRLVQVQGMIISKTLSEIVKKITEKLTYKLT
ncbi:putative dynamin-related protein 4A isoform X3 [Arachis ipaensis]|uniref:putative dynamin-related protein 4A isoform X3 n=1 Tax=Arachis ipaensis TaxID=130454 RepID=UPI000A2B4C43|nr:putative dynamin-related protein 4A isoform X3 [Arachis ipaensis]XP_025650862.1 putative dynamin-related protein 4A isoform X1 [Arachis hypogaea]